MRPTVPRFTQPCRSPGQRRHDDVVGSDSTLLRIQRGLVNDSPTSRAQSSNAVTDVLRNVSADDAAVIALMLSALRATEHNAAAAESQLHGLAEIAESHDLPSAAAHRAVQPPRVLAWSGSELEYVEYLRDHAST